VRAQAYAALGIPFVDVDVSRLVEGVRNGQAGEDLTSSPNTATRPAGADANAGLVGAFRSQLEENVALAALGL
jgi:hypothetical protein